MDIKKTVSVTYKLPLQNLPRGSEEKWENLD
jgi:hypothetical protein